MHLCVCVNTVNIKCTSYCVLIIKVGETHLLDEKHSSIVDESLHFILVETEALKD